MLGVVCSATNGVEYLAMLPFCSGSLFIDRHIGKCRNDKRPMCVSSKHEFELEEFFVGYVSLNSLVVCGIYE